MKKPSAKLGRRSLLAKISATLDRLQPENPDGGTYEHARSTESSPTYIRYVVTTGIRAFDDRVGGMPIGKATELCGLPKSGKTNMAVRTCVRAQQGFIYERVQAEDGSVTLQQLKPGTYNVTILYYDNEGSLSDFNNRVVDRTVMDGEIIQCETIELLWKTMDGVMQDMDAEQEENPEIVQFLIVVIDTVGSMTTKMELDAAWGKTDFPRVPAQLKAGFKAMTSRMQRENVLLMGLNHVSRKMTSRAGTGPPAFKGWSYDSPGGLAFSYFSTHQVYFEMLQRKYCLRSQGEADGILVYFLTEKNRMLPMLRQCNLALLFGLKDRLSGKLIQEGGFKDDWSLLECLIYHKAAKISRNTGFITFYFAKFGVPMTTFGAAAVPSLEEQDEAAPIPPPSRRMAARPRLAEGEEHKKKDPRIPNRMAWLEFYQQHQADVEALYEIVTDRSLKGSFGVTLPGMDDAEEEEGDEGGISP